MPTDRQYRGFNISRKFGLHSLLDSFSRNFTVFIENHLQLGEAMMRQQTGKYFLVRSKTSFSC